MKTVLSLFVIVLLSSSASFAAEIQLAPKSNSDQIKDEALRWASKKFLTVSEPLYGSDRRLAAVTVQSGIQICNLLLSKLLVPGTTDKGVWIVEKSECR